MPDTMTRRGIRGSRGRASAENLRRLLASADPLAKAPELSVEQARDMRRAVMAAADTPRTGTSLWPRAATIAALVIVMIASGIVIGGKLARDDDASSTPLLQSAAQEERRQLQFATPGGTRIIWTLDPEFEVERGTP